MAGPVAAGLGVGSPHLQPIIPSNAERINARDRPCRAYSVQPSQIPVSIRRWISRSRCCSSGVRPASGPSAAPGGLVWPTPVVSRVAGPKRAGDPGIPRRRLRLREERRRGEGSRQEDGETGFATHGDLLPGFGLASRIGVLTILGVNVRGKLGLPDLCDAPTVPKFLYRHPAAAQRKLGPVTADETGWSGMRSALVSSVSDRGSRVLVFDDPRDDGEGCRRARRMDFMRRSISLCVQYGTRSALAS